jgi:hypothetical protein
MENSYKYYNNTSCKYMPCHKAEEGSDFNCMFCYCPLYLIKDCGGKYTVHYGIKDCSSCLIPHTPKGYDYINSMLMEYTRNNPLEE